jgi:hypothetical protein
VRLVRSIFPAHWQSISGPARPFFALRQSLSVPTSSFRALKTHTLPRLTRPRTTPSSSTEDELNFIPAKSLILDGGQAFSMLSPPQQLPSDLLHISTSPQKEQALLGANLPKTRRSVDCQGIRIHSKTRPGEYSSRPVRLTPPKPPFPITEATLTSAMR